MIKSKSMKLFFTHLSLVFASLGLYAFASPGASAATYDQVLDVAIYGAHAHINSPTTRMKINGSSGAAVYRVVVESACISQTAGSPGMTATYDGQTKSSNNPANCSGGDFVFNNVRADRTIRFDKINGEGHQPFKLSAYGPGVSITQLGSDGRYNQRWNGNDDNAAFTVWPAQNNTIEATPECSDRANSRKIFIKWKDADDGNGDNSNRNVTLYVEATEQSGQRLSLQTWSIGTIGSGTSSSEEYKQYVGGQGVYGSKALYLTPETTQIKVWWSGVGNNAIQMSMPYESTSTPNCYIAPEGTIREVNCGGSRIRGWAYDANWPARHVSYRIKIDNASTSDSSGLIPGASGVANSNQGYKSPPSHDFYANVDVSSYFPSRRTHTFYLQVRDINSAGNEGGWVNVNNKTETKDCSGNPVRPDYTVDVQCNGVWLRGVHDDNSAVGVQVFAKYYNRSIVNGAESYSPVNASSFVDWGPVDDRSGDVFIPWPGPSATGWAMHIGDYDAGPGGADSNPRYHFSAELEGGCLAATCTLDTIGNVPGGGPNDVKGGVNFNVTATISNNPYNIPVEVYDHPAYDDGNANTGAFTIAGRATVPNDTLPSSLGGAPLAITNGGGYYPIINGVNQGFPDIPRGQSRSVNLTFTAPAETTADKEVKGYPDYWQVLGLGPGCTDSSGVGPPPPTSIYLPFKIDPSIDNVQADSNENPEKIDYTSRTTQTTSGSDPGGSPYYPSPIPGTATSRLIYYDNGNRNDPLLSNNVRPGSYGNAVWDESNGNVWNDTPLPGRQFDHGGATGTWKPGDRFCAQITIEPATGWIGPGGAIKNAAPNSATDCDTAADQPYVRTYGADVFAGGQFGSAGGNPNASVLANYKNAAGLGSGGEFAAYALGSIGGYNTASLRTSTAPLPALGLAFANTGTGAPGHYTASREVPDYFAKSLKPETSESAATNINVNASTYADKGQTLMRPSSAINISNANNYNKKHAFFIEGDVVITDNIVYSNAGTWSNIESIPSFRLYVVGNIYIDKSVTQLDGMFVAQPKSDGSGGTIYTCTNGSSLFSQDVLYSNCGNRLRVNGAFVSQSLKLLRTYKTVTDAQPKEEFNNTNAAESFRLTPDLFLSIPALRADGSQANGEWDYVVSLPPVL